MPRWLRVGETSRCIVQGGQNESGNKNGQYRKLAHLRRVGVQAELASFRVSPLCEGKPGYCSATSKGLGLTDFRTEGASETV